MEIRTDFPGANGKNFQQISDSHLRFEADDRGGKYSMWFDFIVESPRCRILRCEMVNSKKCLGWPSWSFAMPVFRRKNEKWQRVKSDVKINAEGGVFEFGVPCNKKTTEIAFCYPYQVIHWQRFYKNYLVFKKIKRIEIGRTERDRPVYVYESGKGKKGILLTARFHSGETPGSFTLEGIIKGFLSDSNKNLKLHIIPFVDLDGVEEGMYGKERFPVDFNRDWGKDTIRPETAAYKKYIDSLKTKPVIAIECHAPTPNDSSFIVTTVCKKSSRKFNEEFSSLIKSIMKESNEQEVLISEEDSRPHPEWFEPGGFENVFSGYFQSTYGTLAFCIESSYCFLKNGTIMNPHRWRKLGKAVARGINKWLENDRRKT